jgi:hypothetical protein
MTERRRFFFVHLQKTAGTRLIRRIRDNFPERAVYPLESDGDQVPRVISVDNLLAVWVARGDEIRVVTGHFPLCVADLLHAEFATLTLLRHPLDRTVSYLRHHRRRTPADAELTLEEVYDDDSRFNGLVHNHMTKMLSLVPEEMDDGALTRVRFTRERLERAKERLAGVDAVGLQEDFEAFCREVSTRFGWTLIDHHMPPWGPRPAVELAPEFRARILEDNAYDVELYEFARRLVAERSRVAS